MKRRVFYNKRVFLEKTLPLEGQILVKPGDLVKSFDILGNTFLSRDSKEFNLPPRVKVLVQDGESVAYDQVLAKKPGLLRSLKFRAPFAGTVRVESNTLLKLIAPAEKFNLVSGIEARVVRVVDKLSVLLETEAIVVNGVWGAGDESVGELKVIDNGGQVLTTKDLGADDLGKILVFFGFVSESVLQKAKTVGTAGIVCASLEKSVQSYPLTVLATEGFGPASMPKKLREYLLSFSLKTGVISPARRQLIIPGLRDEKLPNSDETETRKEVSAGIVVQVLVWPYFGQEAEVVEVLGESTFGSGIRAPSLSIRLLETRDLITIPLVNVLILD